MIDSKLANTIEIFGITDVSDFDSADAGEDTHARRGVAKLVQPVLEIGRLPNFDHM